MNEGSAQPAKCVGPRMAHLRADDGCRESQMGHMREREREGGWDRQTDKERVRERRRGRETSGCMCMDIGVKGGASSMTFKWLERIRITTLFDILGVQLFWHMMRVSEWIKIINQGTIVAGFSLDQFEQPRIGELSLTCKQDGAVKSKNWSSSFFCCHSYGETTPNNEVHSFL